MAIAHPGEALNNPQVNFWVVRHGLSMLLALGVFHMGRAKAKRAIVQNRFRIYAITFTGLIVIVFSAIPWTWLNYGRPWFLWYF